MNRVSRSSLFQGKRVSRPRPLALLVFHALPLLLAAGCREGRPPPDLGGGAGPADLLITNARVYSFAWPEPDGEGTPAADAPFEEDGWRPDAEAVGIRDGLITFVGGADAAGGLRGPETRVIDAGGATVLPGLVDAHVHVAELGGRLEGAVLVGVETEAEAIARVVERARGVPAGEWVLGWGWDEGAWADRYPTHDALSEAVPEHPVLLRGLHGFAVWANRLAMDRAGIDGATRAPSGGEIWRDAAGEPTGIFLNRATALFDDAIPPPTPERTRERVLRGLEAMAGAGYVMVHEAGARSDVMEALGTLESEGRLPIRVYAMFSGRDPALLDAWLARGPDEVGDAGASERLITRSVKGHFDGALGSRGALLFEEYSDRPGHTGTGSTGYGYDHERIDALARAGFQPAIHAIGDRGNRETLDFLASIDDEPSEVRALRPRIEHAQVVHPDDFARFAELGAIASMQPPHMAEDKAWAEERLGPERIRGAYAWRAFRRAGVPLVLSSDLPGSDHDPFYGLHSAVTRQDREGSPPGGWFAEQALTPEEAVRGYSTWAAYTAGLEDHTGRLVPGAWADLTVLSVDPMAMPRERYRDVLSGAVLYTIVAGQVVYERPAGEHLAGSGESPGAR